MPAAGYPVEWIEVEGLRGKGIGRWLGAPLRLLRAVAQARARAATPHARRRARLRRLRLRPGRHRGLARGHAARDPRAERRRRPRPTAGSRVSPRASRKDFPAASRRRAGAIYVGNPVRPEIAALPPPRQRFESRNGPMRLFVFGGSQGASALNRLVPAAVALLPEGAPALGPAPDRREGPRRDRGGLSCRRRPGRGACLHRRHGGGLRQCRPRRLARGRLDRRRARGRRRRRRSSSRFPRPSTTTRPAMPSGSGASSAAQVVSETGLTAPELANRLATLFGNGRARLLAMAEAARALAVTGCRAARRRALPAGGREARDERPHAARRASST